jgi:hypothetical protein
MLYGQDVGCVYKGHGTYHNQWDLGGSVGTSTALFVCGSQTVKLKKEGTLRAVRDRIMRITQYQSTGE